MPQIQRVSLFVAFATLSCSGAKAPVHELPGVVQGATTGSGTTTGGTTATTGGVTSAGSTNATGTTSTTTGGTSAGTTTTGTTTTGGTSAGTTTGGTTAAPPGPLSVWTHHNDNNRSGSNAQETILTVGNVNTTSFGKVFTRNVDGSIQAQPLFVAALPFPQDQAVHDAVFVATMNNSVYAFDATVAANSTALWHVTLGTPVPVEDYQFTYPGSEPAVGILGTPVIDVANQILYVVAATKQTVGGNPVYQHHLHALDLLTGAEKPNSPVTIAGSVPGNAPDAVNGVVTFNSLEQIQRPALLLVNGQVFVSFGSHGDQTPFHGWMMRFDGTSLLQTGIYNTTPNSEGASFWQSGEGPAADANGSVYGVTGNSYGADATLSTERTESVVRLSSDASGIALADWFTPYDWQTLDNEDLDLGAGGLLLVPDSQLAICGSKTGSVYVVDRQNLGHIANDDSQIVQKFVVVSEPNDILFEAPIYYKGAQNSYIYTAGQGDVIRAFQQSGTGFITTATSQSASAGPNAGGIPGGFMSISANGTTAGTAILWQIVLSDGSQLATGILNAYDATNLGSLLYSNQQNINRDKLTTVSKFSPPTVVNGRVYVATFDNQLVVYGLLGQ